MLNGLKRPPKHLSESRLVVLSKTSKPEDAVEKTRPIMVNSHSLKIIEKAILFKLEEIDSNIFKVPDY